MDGIFNALAEVLASLMPASEAGGDVCAVMGTRVANALAQGLLARDGRAAHRGALDACAWMREHMQKHEYDLYRGPVIGWPETLALFVRLAELVRATIAISKCDEQNRVSPTLFARERVRMAVDMITGDATCSPQPEALAALAVLDRALAAHIVESVRVLGNTAVGLELLNGLKGLDVDAERVLNDLRTTVTEGLPPNTQPFVLPPPPPSVH